MLRCQDVLEAQGQLGRASATPPESADGAEAHWLALEEAQGWKFQDSYERICGTHFHVLTLHSSLVSTELPLGSWKEVLLQRALVECDTIVTQTQMGGGRGGGGIQPNEGGLESLRACPKTLSRTLAFLTVPKAIPKSPRKG